MNQEHRRMPDKKTFPYGHEIEITRYTCSRALVVQRRQKPRKTSAPITYHPILINRADNWGIYMEFTHWSLFGRGPTHAQIQKDLEDHRHKARLKLDIKTEQRTLLILCNWRNEANWCLYDIDVCREMQIAHRRMNYYENAWSA